MHQHVREIEGRIDHGTGDRKRSVERQYAPAHPVTLTPGGMLAAMFTGMEDAEGFTVNSLHNQGIDRLAAPLRIEAVAPDGTIEAVSLQNPKGFLLGVQWHPEWGFRANAASRTIFAHFGKAMRQAREGRR